MRMKWLISMATLLLNFLHWVNVLIGGAKAHRIRNLKTFWLARTRIPSPPPRQAFLFPLRITVIISVTGKGIDFLRSIMLLQVILVVMQDVQGWFGLEWAIKVCYLYKRWAFLLSTWTSLVACVFRFMGLCGCRNCLWEATTFQNQ